MDLSRWGGGPYEGPLLNPFYPACPRGLSGSSRQNYPGRNLGIGKLPVAFSRCSRGPLGFHSATLLKSGKDWRLLLGVFAALIFVATLIPISSQWQVLPRHTQGSDYGSLALSEKYGVT
jgi:hypothetical protein